MEPFWFHARPEMAQMPNLSIKNVPEDIVRKLRARAEANHRSLQGELMMLVYAAARNEFPPASPDAPVDNVARQPQGWKTVEQIWQEGPQQPVAEGPLSADILRQDRDAR